MILWSTKIVRRLWSLIEMDHFHCPNTREWTKSVYLYSLMKKYGSSTYERGEELHLARDVLSKLSVMWKDRGMSRNTRLKLLKALVFFLYGAETWTIRTSESERMMPKDIMDGKDI